ncbi:hypothetical protein ACLOJK_014352 [Asimina triloba]
MSALHRLFTGLLCLVILLHPRGKVYCFRPRSPSISRSTKKKTPPQSSSCSSSSPPSSPLPPPAKAEKKPPPSSYQSHSAHLPAEKNLMCTHEEVSHERSCYQVLELDPSEFAAGVVQKIFQRGWTQMGVAPPAVHKILKINHSSESLINDDGFEGYRRRLQARGSTSDDGRLLFDGNEILGYWCCHLPNAPAQLTTMPMPKEILVSRSSRRAHEKMHEIGVEGDSRTRAMFVCRAIAGRVGEQRRRRRGGGLVEEEVEGGGGHVFDSLAVGQDLLVLDAKAILPCFVVVFEDDDGCNSCAQN